MSEQMDINKEKAIKSNTLLNKSICELINFFIKTTNKRVVDVNIFNNFFSLRIYGEFNEAEEFNNQVLKALLSLCKEAYFVTVKNKMKTVKIIDFSTYKQGVYNEKTVSTLSVDDKTDSVGFIIYKKNYKPLIENLMNEESRQSLNEYINDVYSNSLDYLKVRVFNNVLEKIEVDGCLLQEKDIKDNIKIQLYRMNKNCKSLDIIVNGVKLKDKVNSKIINWNKYPYRQKGYSFRKMSVVISINEDRIDLNDENFIKNIIDLSNTYIEELIENNKDYFKNDKIYLNLDYDKNKMDYIVKATGCKNPIESVKKVLDLYYLENE